MMKNLMNKWYNEPEDGKFEDATKEILEAVSGDSNTDYDGACSAYTRASS